MANYISVLNSDTNMSYWKAIQWDDSLTSLRANKYYTAGYNQNIPKSDEDEILQTDKQVTEINTGAQGTATIIRLGSHSTNRLKLASNKASKKFTKNLPL